MLSKGLFPSIGGLLLVLGTACGSATSPAPSQAGASPAGASAPSQASVAKPASSASASAATKPAQPSGSGSAAAKALTTYKVGASAVNSQLLPIQLGAEHGLYDKYGIKVEFGATGVGNTTIAAMESGEIAAAYINPSNVAEAVAGGSTIRSVMSVSTKSSYLLVVSPEINKVEDMKGKAFAVANPGGLASNVAEAFLESQGLKSPTNIALINLGTEPTRLQAVQSGQVAGTVINPAFRDKIGNLKVLLDLRDLDIGFPGGGLAISGKVLKGQPDVAEALVKGTWDGIKFIIDPAQKDKVLAGFVKYLQLDPGSAPAAYEELQKDFKGSLPPTLDPKGVTKSIDFLARSNPGVAKLKAEDVVDSSIVDKLVAQGYK